jgi:diphthamide biosynthesis methyltransferase
MDTISSKILGGNERIEEIIDMPKMEEETEAQKIVKLIEERKVSEKHYQVLLLDAQQREQEAFERYKQLFECLEETKKHLDKLTVIVEQNSGYKSYDGLLIPNGSSIITLDLDQQIEQFEGENMTEQQYTQILLEAHKREQDAVEKHDIIIEYSEELNEQFEQVIEAVEELLPYDE